MSTDYPLPPIVGQTDLAVNNNEGEFHVNLCISGSQTLPGITDEPLPRPERRRRRAKADRGLPPDAELALLARGYLERQRKLWPGMSNAGFLPEPTDTVVGQMVENFKERHRTGKVDVETILAIKKICENIGGAYERYSCDNSSPTSILDQVINILDKARADDCFIPWEYLFADYSISGLDASRQGYGSYKSVLADENQLIQVTYIDDFTRASRDELEWWKLGALSKFLRKGMIGASDGVDLSNPNSDILITVFGLVSRLFIKSLKEKVVRGMKGAARRGTCLGKLSLGFTRRVHRDPNGNIVYRPDGRPRHEPCIDPGTQPSRLLMYELFVQQNWTAYQIARYFNQLKVDGWEGWTERAVKKLLWNENAIGIFIWNKTHREFDLEKEKWVVKKNPPSAWERHYDPDLAIVPKELWRAARLKLWKMRKASPLTGKKQSRNQASSTTLFSGTLFCKHCDEELTLVRSTPKYKQMGCSNGVTGSHGCLLSSSKSVRVIEECLLPFLHSIVLAQGRVEDQVAKANEVVEQEAQKPQVETAPLKAKARKLENAIDKLMERVEDTTDDELCDVYDKRILALRKKLKPIAAQLREAENSNSKRPKPLPVEQAMAYLADFRKTMNAEIPVAAEAIRKLTGPILIRQEKISGRPGASWIATFSPNFMQVLRDVTSKTDKTVLAIEGVIEPTQVEVVIDNVPKYERLAPLFLQMEKNGASVMTIASAHKMSWKYAKEILDFAKTGKRPEWKAGKRTGTGQAKPAKYPDIQKRVAELRDVKKLPFPEIAAQLKVGLGTVYRAYDSFHQEDVRLAAERGEKPNRGQATRLGDDKYQLIRKLLREGTKDAEVAAKVGCGQSTVARERRKMKAEADGDQAA